MFAGVFIMICCALIIANLVIAC